MDELHFTKTGTTYTCDRCGEDVANWAGNPGDRIAIELALARHRLTHAEADVVLLMDERQTPTLRRADACECPATEPP